MKFTLPLSILALTVTAFAAPEPVSSQEIELKPGWNQVTITKPLDKAPMNIKKFLDFEPFMLDKERSTLVRCTSKNAVKIGEGYWVFSPKADKITLAQDVTQTTWETADVSPSWNLIGRAEKSSWMDKVSTTFVWKDGRFQPVSAADLQLGEACWTFLPAGK